jgi:prepilin-type N-terminal cleavage/methylation domain-containing protein
MGRRGFTLVEMMVAMVIMGIMGIALVGFLRTQHQTVVRQSSGVLATQNARAAVDMLVRELRNAAYNPRRSPSGGALVTIKADSVSWTSDLDLDGDTLSSSTSWDERVAYYKHNRRLMRAAAGGDGIAVTYDVDSLRFTYYDGAGATTADPDLVEQVLISLYYATPEGVQSGVIESQVALRNNIYTN